MPIISIIVAAYNVENFVDRCLHSLVSQTFSSIEIILIDDGSTDNTPALCDTWAEKDARVRVIHQENKGLSGVCNVGVAAAQGDYIAFVDGDDWIDATMYEKLHRLAEKHQAEIAVAGYTLVWNDGREQKHQLIQQGELLRTFREALFSLLIDRSEKSYRWNKLYKRSLFNGVVFPVNRVFEDLACLHEVYAKATKVAYTQECLCYYYQRSTSIIGAVSPLKEFDFFLANIDRLQFLENCKVFSEQQKNILRVRTTKRLVCSAYHFYRMTERGAYLEEKEQIKKCIQIIYRPNFNFEAYRLDTLWMYIKSAVYIGWLK